MCFNLHECLLFIRLSLVHQRDLSFNMFTTSGGDLKSKDSAEMTDKNSTDLSVK